MKTKLDFRYITSAWYLNVFFLLILMCLRVIVILNFFLGVKLRHCSRCNYCKEPWHANYCMHLKGEEKGRNLNQNHSSLGMYICFCSVK